MDPIAFGIRYQLGEKEYDKYLKFISQWQQLRETVSLDPLAIHVPPDRLELVYVERAEVEKQIYRQGCKIIMGAKGSGKTALWQKQHSVRDSSGHNVTFLRVSPDVLTSACLARHKTHKKSKILIDDTERLGEQAFIDLIQTTQQWYALTTGLLEFIVFATRERQALLAEIESVRQGNLIVYELPPWQEVELQALLGLRLAAWRPDFIDYNSFIKKTPGIPANILNRLRDSLQNYKQFESNADLRAVFADDRIAPWRNELPQPADQGSRIDQTIDLLWQRENIQRENGLILFLYVLSEATDNRDIRKQRLTKLAQDLEAVWQPLQLPSLAPPSSDYTLNWAMSLPNLKDDEAKREFIPMILKGALRVPPAQRDLDAPIHALNLARGLIAACAGCWEDRFPPQSLDKENLQKIINIYWGGER